MSNNNFKVTATVKIIRVILFLIPILIITVMSSFMGKEKAAARYYRFNITFAFLFYIFIFIVLSILTLKYIFKQNKNEKEKKTLTYDLLGALFFLVFSIIFFFVWKYNMKLSNSNAAKIQVTRTTLNAASTTRNLLR